MVMENEYLKKEYGPVAEFVRRHFRHFNAATVVDAAEAYRSALASGSKMMITLAGAMSTAELGISLADMIRADKVHIISCTGANLEEDIFNLVAHSHYRRLPNWRDLSAADDAALLEGHFNRVTDTCIPEEEAMRRIERKLVEVWQQAQEKGERYFPHEYIYQMLDSGVLEDDFDIDPRDSWVVAAAEKGIPIIVPGWEDSTTGNMFAAYCLDKNDLSPSKDHSPSIVRSGVEYMMFLAKWYQEQAGEMGVGFLQIGGGIAGDFPICVVPMLHQDMQLDGIPCWSYFCQISDSTTSYGSYSGAPPNEKITWGKLLEDTPRFMIESDATIVAPLIFAQILADG